MRLLHSVGFCGKYECLPKAAEFLSGRNSSYGNGGHICDRGHYTMWIEGTTLDGTKGTTYGIEGTTLDGIKGITYEILLSHGKGGYIWESKALPHYTIWHRGLK